MPCLRRIYRQGNSWVVSVPEWALDQCGLSGGSAVLVEVERGPVIVLKPYSGVLRKKLGEERPIPEAKGEEL